MTDLVKVALITPMPATIAAMVGVGNAIRLKSVEAKVDGHSTLQDERLDDLRKDLGVANQGVARAEGAKEEREREK